MFVGISDISKLTYVEMLLELTKYVGRDMILGEIIKGSSEDMVMYLIAEIENLARQSSKWVLKNGKFIEKKNEYTAVEKIEERLDNDDNNGNVVDKLEKIVELFRLLGIKADRCD